MWRKTGIQGFKVCRYLFVRCDNNDAPWTSDEYGDWPRPLPVIPKLENAVDITKRKEGSSWDFNMSMETGQLNMRRACRRSIFNLIIQRHSYSALVSQVVLSALGCLEGTSYLLRYQMVSSPTMNIAWDDAGCLCPGGDLFNYAAPGEEANVGLGLFCPIS
ncbi:hypothetical protein JRO89_XS11G0039900 [Xanthoceras sorbifolium]|uniref:Uncharacterized protein n=1 Tax=Xanthoceras sorbifolium TaxID=99658 RepID=A0ABQ8HEK8_9ROSI|nr:hypothetical protein JRO89_XS11G0039900 [Xanthoceras sorbifolium]